MIEIGKTYKTKFQTEEKFTVEKITTNIKGEVVKAFGFYEKSPHLKNCPINIDRLEHDFDNKKRNLTFLTEYNGEKQTKISLDRTRNINYNGTELPVNTFKCSNCKEEYFFEEIPHEFCPFCGTKYKYSTDVSV